METQQFAGGSLLFHILYEYAVSLRQITDLLKKVEVLDFTCFVGCCGFWLCQEPTEWQRYWEATKLEGRLETVEEGSWVPSALSSRASSNSFNSYLTFVGKKGPDAPESDEVIGEFEEALCTQESYRMSFDGSDSDDSLEEAEVTVHPMPPRGSSSRESSPPSSLRPKPRAERQVETLQRHMEHQRQLQRRRMIRAYG
eukprot:g694.t1